MSSWEFWINKCFVFSRLMGNMYDIERFALIHFFSRYCLSRHLWLFEETLWLLDLSSHCKRDFKRDKEILNLVCSHVFEGLLHHTWWNALWVVFSMIGENNIFFLFFIVWFMKIVLMIYLLNHTCVFLPSWNFAR